MNSQYALDQLPGVIAKLLARTTEGKISWGEGTILNTSDRERPEELFETSLDDGLRASIEVTPSKLTFFISPSDSFLQRLLEINFDRIPPRYGFDSPVEDAAYRDLVALYEIARRLALQLDTKIENVKSYLDRLAGIGGIN